MYELNHGGKLIKVWADGVPVEQEAIQQLSRISRLPIIHNHLAVMPDVHYGIGATVGSVIPTVRAVIPAAVGVDIGCGMMAVRTNLNAARLPDSLKDIRLEIEAAIPHGGPGVKGSWQENGYKKPKFVSSFFKGDGWKEKGLQYVYEAIIEKHPLIDSKADPSDQLGTLGGGNHFIEICLDETDCVWLMLHSGSRGVGNRIGRYFIDKAKEQIKSSGTKLEDSNLAWLSDGTEDFADYILAVSWAQKYAHHNRQIMMNLLIGVMQNKFHDMQIDSMAVNCHHNYVGFEKHFDTDVIVTRKGAVSAKAGEYGIIPGSMGAKSFIVQGLGNTESYHSCSHGAGRVMSRTAAKARFTVDDHADATKHVECRKDSGVIDETPMAYKDIDAVMAAQSDLVKVIHTLRQVVCVKG